MGVIGGRVLPMWQSEVPDWVDEKILHQLALIDWGDEPASISHSDRKWLLTANAAYRLAVLKKAGGFPNHLGRKRKLPLAQEEFAINQKILELGYQLQYSPDLKVHHFISEERVTKEALIKDGFWDGVSQILLSTKDFNEKDTDRLTEKLRPVLNELVLKVDKKNISNNLFDTVNEFRGKGAEFSKQFLNHIGENSNYENFAWPVLYIVTPSLNSVNTIDQTIMSVVTQAGNFSIRYHIQDGLSTDGTLSKLEKWKDYLYGETCLFRHCRNIVFTYESLKDHGMYDAISKGFSYMNIPTNAAMTWINSDDYLMPGALATVQKAFSISDKISWIIGSVHTCTENSYPVASHQYSFPQTIIRAGLCDGYHWQHVQQEGVFWRKSLWDKVGGLNISYKFAGDWDLWRRFAEYCTPIQTEWPLGCFRSRPDQMTKNLDAYNSEVENWVSFNKRQEELHKIIQTKEKISKQVLTGTQNKNYEVKENYLDNENIPGCTWLNCPDLGKTLLNMSPIQYTPVAANEEAFEPENGNIDGLDFATNLSALNFSTISSGLELSPVSEQPNVFFVKGWHSDGSDDTGWWRWCSGLGTIHIRTAQAHKSELFITLNFFNKKDEISICLNGEEIFNEKIDLDPREYGPLEIQLKMGTNIISIYPKKFIEKTPGGHESQIFMVKNFRISLNEKYVPGLREKVAITRMVKQLKNSKLFFRDYYLAQSAELYLKNFQAEFHYLFYGAWENMNPNPVFDSSWYLTKYTDVHLSGMNPLRHFMLHGWKEGRDPHPEFSTNDYLDYYEDVKNSGMNPLLHYFAHGIFEGRNIFPSR